MEPLFIVTERFDPLRGEAWHSYVAWSKLTAAFCSSLWLLKQQFVLLPQRSPSTVADILDAVRTCQ